MQVAFFPNHWRANPYLDLLEEGLRGQDILVVRDPADRPYLWWLRQHRGDVQVLHFHWLHSIYHEKTYWKSLIRLLKFASQLVFARLLGYRIVWTVHNLMPHERPYPHLDSWARRLITAVSNSIIVHCYAAREAVDVRYRPRAKIFVSPHGSYVSELGDQIERTTARVEIGPMGKFSSVVFPRIEITPRFRSQEPSSAVAFRRQLRAKLLLPTLKAENPIEAKTRLRVFLFHFSLIGIDVGQ